MLIPLMHVAPTHTRLQETPLSISKQSTITLGHPAANDSGAPFNSAKRSMTAVLTHSK